MWQKMKKVLCMTLRHTERRLEWAMEKVGWSVEKWSGVVFTDEKKFNLDGPDGFRYYWHDIRNEPRIFSKQQNGGGSLMTWGGFSANGKTNIAICSSKQNYAKHILSFGTI